MLKKPTNEQQKILDYNGNIVVTAKPGSGKTYTIVEKIAQIIPQLPKYKGIIAISFTNKASDELKKRCKKRCQDTQQSFFGTIDKFYISQIIIPFACHITGKFFEYEIVREIDSESKYGEFVKLDDGFTKAKISLLVDGLKEGKIFLNYTGETALIILNKVPGAIKYLQAKYSHIFIDEYQDCGSIQNEIFTKLVDNGLYGIAVGDVNQAIYGFSNRFPKFLLSLIKRNDFKHFELSKNHRCHNSISEYSLCLFNSSKIIPEEKRVFKVNITGDERDIVSKIDSLINRIKNRYGVTNNNQIAILCRSNGGLYNISRHLKTPHKLFNETCLDRDNSDWGRFFRDILLSRFDESIYAPDYAENLFSEEFEGTKYRKALSLCSDIFSCSIDEITSIEEKMIQLAKLVYPEKRNDNALLNLHNVLNNYNLIQNYLPATDNEINLMTLHKSKGLEFNIVFHMDMYKWIIPNEHGNEQDQQQDLNLHYVGITRAKDVCFIMQGTKRYRSRQDDYVIAEPSPFLNLPGLDLRRSDINWDKK